MDVATDSDTNVTMLATKSFDMIIEQIQTSCLNYQIQISPFSALISIKKTLIKDQSGKPRLPTIFNKAASEHIEALVVKNRELERKLTSITNEHAKMIHECDEAYKTIEKLQNFNQEIKFEATSSEHLKGIETELVVLKEALKNRDDEILELQIDKNAAKEASIKLNGVLSKNRMKFENEKNLFVKEHRSEVKALKKDLGEETRNRIKLEEKLAKLFNEKENKQVHEKKRRKKPVKKPAEPKPSPGIFCSICANPIDNYLPEYFCGEKFNPACQACKANDSSWCPDDPFSSFPSSSQPASLVSHWLLPPQQSLAQNPSSISSLVSHCVKLSNPGDSFIATDYIRINSFFTYNGLQCSHSDTAHKSVTKICYFSAYNV